MTWTESGACPSPNRLAPELLVAGSFSISLYEPVSFPDQYGGQYHPVPGRVMSRRFLFRLFAAAASTRDHVSDGELLRRFVAAHDSAAFELLVRRHADAVWTAAVRIVANESDAEDIFQATFLALMKKAGSVRNECVGGWLYRVAVNASLKLKASRERQRPEDGSLREQDNLRDKENLRSLTLPARQDRDEPEQYELAAIIHQELAQLPERYRLPVVLCDLEGQTHAEAAKALGWPVGSVSGRLSRAHAILRDRLTRRGLGLPAVLIVATSAPPTAISAAAALAAGVAVSPAVSTLAEGVLSAMRIAKLKLAGAVVAASGLVAIAGVGSVLAVMQNPKAPPSAEPATGPPAQASKDSKPKDLPTVTKSGDTITAFPDLDVKNISDLTTKCPKLFGTTDVPIDPKAGVLRQLQTARLNSALAELRMTTKRVQGGVVTVMTLVAAVNRVSTAANDLFSDPKDLRPWLEECVRVAKWCEQMADHIAKTGQGTFGDVKEAQFARLEAEIALYRLIEREKKGAKLGK